MYYQIELKMLNEYNIKRSYRTVSPFHKITQNSVAILMIWNTFFMRKSLYWAVLAQHEAKKDKEYF